MFWTHHPTAFVINYAALHLVSSSCFLSTPKHQRNARPTCYSSSVQLRCVKFRDSVQNLDFDRFLCINARKYCSRFLTWNEWPKRIDEPTYYRVAQKCSKGGKILGPPSAHRPIAPQEEIVARKGLTTAYHGIFIKYLLCVCFDVSCPCNFWNGRSWFTAKEAK